MNCNEVLNLLTTWLKNQTGDEGFKNEEVSSLLMMTLATKKMQRNANTILNVHLTVGKSLALELLSDICTMPRNVFLKKWTKM